MPLPALLTVAKGMNEPRLPSLRGKMRAKKQTIPIWGPQEIKAEPDRIGLAGSPTRMLETALPERKSGSKMLEAAWPIRSTPSLIRRICCPEGRWRR